VGLQRGHVLGLLRDVDKDLLEGRLRYAKVDDDVLARLDQLKEGGQPAGHDGRKRVVDVDDLIDLVLSDKLSLGCF